MSQGNGRTKRSEKGLLTPDNCVVALVGLLGILAGEQVIPAAKRLMSGRTIDAAWIKSDCVPHVFGPLPTWPTGKPATPQREQAT